MREIKFRTKNENNEWVFAPIKGNMAGQFTGLKDKNGKEIYEGDIVKIITIDTGNTIYGQIKFGKYRDVNNDDSELGFYLELNGECMSIFNGEREGYYLPNMVEVIGNIYDNPELIEE